MLKPLSINQLWIICSVWLKIISKYLDQTLYEMDKFLECSSGLERYSGFNKSIIENKEKILKYKESVEKIY